MAEQDTDASATASYARLLSLAVHELRTPASVVGGYLRMLQRDDNPPLGPRQKKMVDEAEKSCGRIVGLIAELSEVAKLDAGTAAGGTEDFDLFRTIEEVAAGVHEAGDREVHLQVSGDATGAPMRGDLTRLRAAFAAFFRAVLREQPASCTVVADRRRVTAGGDISAVTIVAESGTVQSAYDAPAGPFDDNRGGLGLLLPIARRVVERQGGRVWSPVLADTSATPGAHTAIIVSLPIGDQARRAPSSKLSPEPKR